MCRWHVAFSSGLRNIPTPVDQVLDGRIVQMHVKIDALCKQWWLPEQHPGKKSMHMLHMLRHQGPLGTVCLQQDSDHVCLWPGYHIHHDTAKHSCSGVVKESTGEWKCFAVFSNENRFSLYMSDGHTVLMYGVDQVSIIFWSTSPMTQRPHLMFHGVGMDQDIGYETVISDICLWQQRTK